MKQWHQQDTNEIYTLTASTSNGITNEEARLRLEQHGPNQLEEKKKISPWMLFLHQFKDFMILILVIAAIIAGVTGETTNMIIILCIVMINAIVGFVQEYRAGKALEALRKMAAPFTTVMRNGAIHNIESIQLVPGDLVIIEAGGIIPADIRLVETHALRLNESSLTGESVAVEKTTNAIDGENIPLGERLNMAYKGTIVTNGRGTGIVVATGMKTEMGHIAGLLQGPDTSTPLQRRMTEFGKKLSYLVLLICVILFVVGWLRGEEPVNMLLVSISLAVAAIPEALPALITITLARGAARMVKKNALIRKLAAVETLGSVTYICTDKTGTLTQNKMTVTSLLPHQSIKIDTAIPILETLMYLNHNVTLTNESQLSGDPTEIAMVEYIQLKFPEDTVSKIPTDYPRVAELPFDSDRKLMTTIHRYHDQFLVISKGAAESILSRTVEGSSIAEVKKQNQDLAANGIRVLGFGIRLIDELPNNLEPAEIENNLRFAGLVGMIDPPREEVKVAIEECRTAGIHPVMITGDHRETATAIAKELGIIKDSSHVMTGPEIEQISAEELDNRVEQIRVYARVSPQQKLDIVKSLQRRNHFVAMTGDGVNDAPALKAADIGVAMGITGTDVSKETAHMILLDDNFATIVKAVKEGRRIYDNIRKFIKYIMTCNGAEIWTIFLAPILGLPIPLLPVHILWINLVTDGLPGLALSAEKAEKDIMQRPPRKSTESLFAGGLGYHIAWVGLLMAFVTLGIQAWAIHNDNPRWQTMVFTVLSLSQLGHVLAIRSETESIYRRGFLSNLPLFGAVIFTLLLQLALIYLPFANRLFGIQPLTIWELLICLGCSAVVFHAVELEKWIKRRMNRHI